MEKNCLSHYAAYLRVERRLSKNTVAAYVADVAGLLAALDMPPEAVAAADVAAYLGGLSATVTKRSQARVLSALRSFFNWMVLEGERKDNPCDRVDAPKLGRYIPQVLSVEEVDAIIRVPGDTDAWKRDRAILEMLYGCGLRVSEACSLRISCVYLEERFVRIVGKGNKERLVPLGEMAAEAFSDWLAVRPEPQRPEYADFAFLNRFAAPLSRVSVFKMVKSRAAAAGVTKEISPHTFRHSFATHLIENGADLRVVQEMLGHESILTTEIYTHIDQRTWQKAVLEHHPRR
ncbi:MAG: tyrosine recombinase [Bacteroidales bacterium]|nr:tyrosine recombinase [Bacteroidales bacterium]